MGKRSLRRAARTGAAVAVVSEVAERAKKAARSSGTAVAAAGASTGRAAKQFGKQVGGRVAATVRTATSNEDAVWAAEKPDGARAGARPQSQDDPVATLRAEAARAQRAKIAAVRAAFTSGVEVPEIARSVDERRSTIKEWLADG